MSKINLEVDESYGEKLDILRKVFVNAEGKEMENNGELVQGLMDTFLEFLQDQASEWHEHSKEWGCCGWGSPETKY